VRIVDDDGFARGYERLSARRQGRWAPSIAAESGISPGRIQSPSIPGRAFDGWTLGFRGCRPFWVRTGAGLRDSGAVARGGTYLEEIALVSLTRSWIICVKVMRTGRKPICEMR